MPRYQPEVNSIGQALFLSFSYYHPDRHRQLRTAAARLPVHTASSGFFSARLSPPATAGHACADDATHSAATVWPPALVVWDPTPTLLDVLFSAVRSQNHSGLEKKNAGECEHQGCELRAAAAAPNLNQNRWTHISGRRRAVIFAGPSFMVASRERVQK